MFYNYIEVLFNSLENYYPNSENFKTIVRENEIIPYFFKLYRKNKNINIDLFQNGGTIPDEIKTSVRTIHSVIENIKNSAKSTEEIKKHFEVVYKIANLLIQYASMINSMLVNGDENLEKIQVQLKEIIEAIQSYN